MEKLKPCPFCGGEAIIEQISKNKLELKCTGCYVKFIAKWLHYSKEWLWSKLIEKWNTRAKEDNG